jgi:hypothetical protein
MNLAEMALDKPVALIATIPVQLLMLVVKVVIIQVVLVGE